MRKAIISSYNKKNFIRKYNFKEFCKLYPFKKNNHNEPIVFLGKMELLGGIPSGLEKDLGDCISGRGGGNQIENAIKDCMDNYHSSGNSNESTGGGGHGHAGSDDWGGNSSSNDNSSRSSSWDYPYKQYYSMKIINCLNSDSYQDSNFSSSLFKEMAIDGYRGSEIATLVEENGNRLIKELTEKGEKEIQSTCQQGKSEINMMQESHNKYMTAANFLKNKLESALDDVNKKNEFLEKKTRGTVNSLSNKFEQALISLQNGNKINLEPINTISKPEQKKRDLEYKKYIQELNIPNDKIFVDKLKIERSYFTELQNFINISESNSIEQKKNEIEKWNEKLLLINNDYKKDLSHKFSILNHSNITKNNLLDLDETVKKEYADSVKQYENYIFNTSKEEDFLNKKVAEEFHKRLIFEDKEEKLNHILMIEKNQEKMYLSKVESLIGVTEENAWKYIQNIKNVRTENEKLKYLQDQSDNLLDKLQDINFDIPDKVNDFLKIKDKMRNSFLTRNKIEEELYTKIRGTFPNIESYIFSGISETLIRNLENSVRSNQEMEKLKELRNKIRSNKEQEDLLQLNKSNETAENLTTNKENLSRPATFGKANEILDEMIKEDPEFYKELVKKDDERANKIMAYIKANHLPDEKGKLPMACNDGVQRVDWEETGNKKEWWINDEYTGKPRQMVANEMDKYMEENPDKFLRLQGIEGTTELAAKGAEIIFIWPNPVPGNHGHVTKANRCGEHSPDPGNLLNGEHSPYVFDTGVGKRDIKHDFLDSFGITKDRNRDRLKQIKVFMRIKNKKAK